MPEDTYYCAKCGSDFKADRPRKYCSKTCRYSKDNFDDNGKFKTNKDIQKSRDKIKSDFGLTNLRSPIDVINENNERLQKAGLMKEDELKKGALFTKDFLAYIGFGQPHSYYWGLDKRIATKINDMNKRRSDMMRLDSGEVFSPIDNMYSTPSESDTWYDYGRIPTSHLVALCMARLGVANTVCSRPAVDMFDNDYEFVKRGDPNGDPVETDAVKLVLNWQDKSRFHKKLAESVEFTEQTGNGHLIATDYLNKNEKSIDWRKKAPNTRPMNFQTFSAYHMTPINIWDDNQLDYDRNSWKFRGGVHTSSEIHESRVFVFGLRRYPYQLRDLGLPETCFVSFLCLLNASYYLLKALAQLGTITIGVQTESIYPSSDEVNAYLTYLQSMKANNFYVLGKGATMKIENAAGKIGNGVPQLLEYFKEDICAAAVFPKNQAFGRAEGGGLSGAGAVVSKEDYLASNLSVKFGMIKRDILWILQNMCNFKGLEGLIPKMNIDLHKTEEQRLMEAMMREDYEQKKIMTQQAKLGQGLYKKQIDLQKKMIDVQKKMFQQDPEGFMQQSDKDEENLEEKKPTKEQKDFMDSLRFEYLQLEREFNHNAKVIDMIRQDTSNLVKINSQDNFAWRKYIDREKRFRD